MNFDVPVTLRWQGQARQCLTTRIQSRLWLDSKQRRQMENLRSSLILHRLRSCRWFYPSAWPWYDYCTGHPVHEDCLSLIVFFGSHSEGPRASFYNINFLAHQLQLQTSHPASTLPLHYGALLVTADMDAVKLLPGCLCNFPLSGRSRPHARCNIKNSDYRSCLLPG